MKQCSMCKQTKPRTAFDKDKYQKSGLSPACKQCRKDRRATYVESDIYKQIHYMANKKYKTTTKGQLSNLKYILKKKYGLSLEEYERLLELQNGVCCICHKECTAATRGTTSLFAVDHDHITGKVRGLLCTKCNSTLGMVSDSIDILQSAINYLRERTVV